MKDQDHYYRKAKEEGYASRAAYKLAQMQKAHRFIAGGDTVLELGAAPGGWTAVLAEIVGGRGEIFAVDLEPMATAMPANVRFYQGDFTQAPLIERLQREMGAADVLVSDAAPSTSGIAFHDAARSAELCQAALQLAALLLKPGGHFLVKMFAGEEAPFLATCRQLFGTVRRLKPDASRKKSREFYVLGLDFQAR